MDHHTSKEVLRLSRLEEWAQAYQNSALESGNTARSIRAARLAIAVDAKMMAIVMGEVSTYRTSD